MYNSVDSIFFCHGVGPLAISGLALTFPLMNLIIAFSTLIGVGGAAIGSIYLGQKEYLKTLKRTPSVTTSSCHLPLRGRLHSFPVC